MWGLSLTSKAALRLPGLVCFDLAVVVLQRWQPGPSRLFLSASPTGVCGCSTKTSWAAWEHRTQPTPSSSSGTAMLLGLPATAAKAKMRVEPYSGPGTENLQCGAFVMETRGQTLPFFFITPPGSQRKGVGGVGITWEHCLPLDMQQTTWKDSVSLQLCQSQDIPETKWGR